MMHHDALSTRKQEPANPLREQAEALVGGKPPNEDAHLLHELRVHQVELEMQNDELRRSQVELALSREHYRELYDEAPVGYITLGRRGEILQANPRAAEIFGMNLAELVSTNLHSRFSADVATELHLHLRTTLQSRTGHHCQLEYCGPNGPSHLRVESAPVFTDDGRHQFRVILSDISEQVRAERELDKVNEELEERVQERTAELHASQGALNRENSAKLATEHKLHLAQKMEAVGRLAGGVAHDFNNTLQVILVSTSLLRSGCSEEQLKLISQIEEAAELASSLTAQLLLFTKRRVLSHEEMNLVKVVASMQTLLEHSLDERIELNIDFDVDEIWIEADRGQLKQLLLNLAINARDAMPQGGELSIRCGVVDISDDNQSIHPDAQIGSYAKITVSDSGTGMSSETMKQAFEPFFTTKELSGGTGMGLANVREFVLQWGGFITVESQIDQGCRFEIYLPTIEDPAQTSRATLSRRPRRVKGGSILLVEDQDQLREGLRRVLGCRSYDVVCARDGVDALRVLEDTGREFDLLLTDILMPNMCGTELATRVRAISPKTQVIYMSGYAGEEELEEGTAFLAKPFSYDKLLDVVSAALDPDKDESGIQDRMQLQLSAEPQ